MNATQTHGFDSLPLLVRPGTVLPVGARRDTPEYAYAHGVALHLFDLAEVGDQVLRIPGDDAASATEFTVRRRDDQLTVTRTAGPEAPWSMVVPAGYRAGDVDGGVPSTDEAGLTSYLKAKWATP